MDDFLKYFGLDFTQQKRDEIFDKPFPSQWDQILKKRIPLFKKMPLELQAQLKKHIQIFIAEKEFIGKNFIITDEVKVILSAQACLLLLNRKTYYLQELRKIIVVPSTWWCDDNKIEVAGSSSSDGEVTVSWNDTLNGVLNDTDGNNVAIHEFAHQLDLETGKTDGTPLLSEYENIKSWSSILKEELKKLKLFSKKGFPTLIGEYGATNEEEFFAVASEVFFEQPGEMRKQHPDLYKQLKCLYHVDPNSWSCLTESSTGQLELHYETRKMNFSITTMLNKRSVILFSGADDNKIWDKLHQMILQKDEGGWSVLHHERAVNETLLNGKAVKIKTRLQNGDILAIGRESKRAVRMPMLVKIK